MLLSALLSNIISPIEEDLEVLGLTPMATEIRPGFLYVDLPSYPYEKVKADYVSEAVKNGAVAVLTESSHSSPSPAWRTIDGLAPVPIYSIENLRFRLSEIAAKFYSNPSDSMTIIGITGTNGKTSISHFTALALDALEQNCAVVGTLGHGKPGEYILKDGYTCPPACRLQYLLAKMKEIGLDTVALEASSIGIDDGRVEAVKFDVAVFTNFSQDHLDWHGTMEKYFTAKKRLFYWPTLKYGIFNLDCEFGRQLLEKVARDRPEVQFYGLSFEPDWAINAHNVHLVTATFQCPNLANGLEISLNTPWGDAKLTCPKLIGQMNAFNVTVVCVICLILGHDLQKVTEALAKLAPVPGRMEVVSSSPTIVVDYAHCAGSLERALSTLKNDTKHKIWCIFGCGGDRDTTKRPQMAANVEKYADEIIVTDDNPRFEDPDEIFEDIRAGFSKEKVGEVRFVHDRRQAIEIALCKAQKDDSILIAGKGAEEFQNIKGRLLPFVDVDVVRELSGNL